MMYQLASEDTEQVGSFVRYLLSCIHPRTRNNLSSTTLSSCIKPSVFARGTQPQAFFSEHSPFLSLVSLPLNHLLTIRKIILAGDSAGAKLASALLLHLVHHHPSGLVPHIQRSSPLQAVLLISPLDSIRHFVTTFQKEL
jgi:hypothetical protein